MKLSIIIPCYNEEDVLNKLFQRLDDIVKQFNFDYEIIFINDGSKDKTKYLIQEKIKTDKNYKAIHFSRNFGHQAALLAGLKHCDGNAAFILDADLQDPPELINNFINKYREDYDVIYGIRKKRQDNFIKRSLYFIYYRLLKIISDIDIPLDSGDYCLISRRVIDIIINMPERNKYIRGLRSWVGFDQIGIEYNRDKRQAGRPKYSLNKLFKLSKDGIFGFSKLPLKIAAWLGIMICFLSLLLGLIYLISFFIFNYHEILPGFTSLILLITFFGGIQLLFIGLIGEYIGRIFDTVNKRPEYIIEFKDNF